MVQTSLQLLAYSTVLLSGGGVQQLPDWNPAKQCLTRVEYRRNFADSVLGTEVPYLKSCPACGCLTLDPDCECNLVNSAVSRCVRRMRWGWRAIRARAAHGISAVQQVCLGGAERLPRGLWYSSAHVRVMLQNEARDNDERESRCCGSAGNTCYEECTPRKPPMSISLDHRQQFLLQPREPGRDCGTANIR